MTSWAFCYEFILSSFRLSGVQLRASAEVYFYTISLHLVTHNTSTAITITIFSSANPHSSSTKSLSSLKASTMDTMSPEEKSNVARGYKSTISNPSTWRRRQRPEQSPLPASSSPEVPKKTRRSGLICVRAKTDTSEEAKQHAREALEKLGDTSFNQGEKDPNRVAGGLKA